MFAEKIFLKIKLAKSHSILQFNLFTSILMYFIEKFNVNKYHLFKVCCHYFFLAF